MIRASSAITPEATSASIQSPFSEFAHKQRLIPASFGLTLKMAYPSTHVDNRYD